MPRVKTKDVFKKGEKYHLDDIYDIQGIGGNGWWESIEDESDDIIIIKDITIEITVIT